MRKFSIASPADNLQLSCLMAEPSCEKPAGIIQIVHGMCEHKERYIPFMEWLASKGYVVIIHDHRGHGESILKAEDLGYMYEGGWKAMVEDVKAVALHVVQLYPALPLHMLGHSMGSMVARSFAKRHDSMLRSLIVCGSPSANPLASVGKGLAWMFGTLGGWHCRPKLLQQMSFGSFNKPFASEGENAWVCSDPQILDAYRKDPLCSFQFTANGFYNLLSLMQDCYSTKGWSVAHEDLPVMFISGSEDPCRTSDKDFMSAVGTMKKAGYKSVTYKLYPAMRHEILNETSKMEVWEDVIEFYTSSLA